MGVLRHRTLLVSLDYTLISLSQAPTVRTHNYAHPCFRGLLDLNGPGVSIHVYHRLLTFTFSALHNCLDYYLLHNTLTLFRAFAGPRT